MWSCEKERGSVAMEPLTIVAISAAVGGTAGKLIEKAWDSGEKWLTSYFRDHHPKAQEKAKQNSLDFLNDLAQRVNQLEADAKGNAKLKQKIDSAIEDPDFSALLKDAVIASSRTDNEDKHKILARIVSERLRFPTENLVSLTSTLACDAVKHLTPKQMRFLGITTFVYFIRPIPFPPAIPLQQFGSWYENWLKSNLPFYLPMEPLGLIDFLHLESVSCIKYEPIVGRDLKQLLSPPAETGYDWSFDGFIQNYPGRGLHELWESAMQHTLVTTTGRLIGIYVHDEVTGTTTNINW